MNRWSRFIVSWLFNTVLFALWLWVFMCVRVIFTYNFVEVFSKQLQIVWFCCWIIQWQMIDQFKYHHLNWMWTHRLWIIYVGREIMLLPDSLMLNIKMEFNSKTQSFCPWVCFRCTYIRFSSQLHMEWGAGRHFRKLPRIGQTEMKRGIDAQSIAFM